MQHCIVAVELFIKTESVTATHYGFWQQFQRCKGPSHNTVLLWVSKWYQEGSVKNSKPRGHPHLARTPDNVERVRDTTLRNLRRPARRQALALSLNKCSVRWVIHKDLHYHPYKIQVAQQLSGWDNSSGICFRADSFLVSGTSPGLPALLTLQYQTISFGAVLKARFMKHILPILQTSNTKFWSVFKESPRKWYNLLWYPFLRDCRSVLNDMVVTYKLSNANSNNWNEISWTWNAPESVNKFFPLFLKKLFHLKNHQVFLMHPVYVYIIFMWLCVFAF